MCRLCDGADGQGAKGWWRGWGGSFRGHETVPQEESKGGDHAAEVVVHGEVSSSSSVFGGSSGTTVRSTGGLIHAGRK